MLNSIPIVKLLLGGEGCKIKHVFIWGAKKCELTKVPHPLNPKQPLVLRNMNMVFNEINPKLNRPLSHMNTLLIDDYPYKCMGNVPYFYILLEPFNIEVDDKNYLLGTLWLYLVGLLEVPNTLRYVGLHHHGQK
jgi:hypothetical protein